MLETVEGYGPQIRIYLGTAQRPSMSGIAAALVEYEVILRLRPVAPYEAVLIRKIVIESEEEFKVECRRVGAILAPMLVAHSSVACLYDDAAGRTTFWSDFEKNGENPELVENS
jgi:hypothetical protein